MFRKLYRFFQILELFYRYRLYQFIPYGQILCVGHLLFFWTIIPPKKQDHAERLADAFQKMGPIFIKIGQLCSTRADIFDAKWLSALMRLQDSITLQPYPQYLCSFETSLSKPAQKRLIVDWSAPVASASLAQVYRAQLDGVHSVVVKIRKPFLKEVIEVDLQIIGVLIPILDFFAPKRLQINQIFEELKRTVRMEIDFRYEAFHAQKMRRLSAPGAKIPIIYEDFTRENLVVMESFESEKKISHYLQADHRLHDLAAKAANDLLKFLSYSLFRDGFFHADLHPGNIFVSPVDGTILLIDFGQVGELSQADHFYMCQQISAFLNFDFHTLTTLLIEAGWVHGQSFDRKSFEKDLEMLLLPLSTAPLEAINLTILVSQLIVLARRYHLKIQTHFLLAQKAILMAEGLARQLNSQLSPFKVLKTDILDAIKQRYGYASFPAHWKQQKWRLEARLLGIQSCDHRHLSCGTGHTPSYNDYWLFFIFFSLMSWVLWVLSPIIGAALCYQLSIIILGHFFFLFIWFYVHRRQ